MPKRSRIPIVKKTLNLRKGDWEFLEKIYAETGQTPSFIIRTMIANYVDQVKKDQI